MILKIVHVEDFFHPEAGYQLNILAKYMAMQGHDVTVVCAELDLIPEYLTSFFGKDHIKEKDADYSRRYHVKILRIPAKSYVSGRVIFGQDLLNAVDNESPDIIYAHGNDTHTSIRLIKWSVKRGIPVVSDSHMMEAASNNCLRSLFRFYYRMMITPVIKKHQIPVIRTVDIDYVERYYGIPLQQCPYISFGSDLEVFHPDEEMRKRIRKEIEIEEDVFVFLYAGKLDEAKGGLFLAKAIKDAFPNNEKLCFLIIGNSVGNYGGEVESCLRESRNRIKRLPTQTYSNLARYYQAADAAVFPRQASLSFFDVQACGLPVVMEDGIDVNRARLSCENGCLFESGSLHSFRNSLMQLYQLSAAEYMKMKHNAIQYVSKKYNYSDRCRDYLKVIVTEYNRHLRGKS